MIELWEPGAVLYDDELVGLCSAELAEDRVYRPSQQIMEMGGSIEVLYFAGAEGASVEVHHLHGEEEEALEEKAAQLACWLAVGVGWNGSRAPIMSWA